MILKITKLKKNAIIPKYQHQNDSGLDLKSIKDYLIPVNGRALVETGIAIELPPNTEAQIRTRSGLSLKHGITVLNSPGTVDEGYRGEIKVILINHGDVPFKVIQGMKIAQLVIVPIIRVEIEEVKELSKTARDCNGFGSTGYVDEVTESVT